MRKLKITIMAIVISALGSVGIIFWPAELKLIETNPQADEILYALDNEIEMLFNKAVDLNASSVKVTDPNGKVVSTGTEAYNSVLLVVTMKSPNAPLGFSGGDYSVAWRVRAVDGDESSGTFKFHNRAHKH